MKKLRIAIMATNLYPTPPNNEKSIYAPLWLTHQLTEGLVKKGHEVFLFGATGSKTKAKLISNNLPPLGEHKEWGKSYKQLNDISKQISEANYGLTWSIKWKEVLRENYEMLLASKLFQMAQQNKFDIIQFHSPIRMLHFASLVKTPVVATIHDTFPHPLGSNAVKLTYKYLDKYYDLHFISVSNAQRKPLPNINYVATIYHGIDIKKFAFKEGPGEYLAFAGRIVPQKGIHVAIEAAKATGHKLKIAGPIPPESETYWQQKIKPQLSSQITYQGMLTSKKMVSFYQNAEALLMPISLPESFGLVMAEAMACGTPVIAFPKGAIPEVIKHKKTGFVVKNQAEMIKAVKNIDKIKREDCRKWVEDNFSLQTMIDNYEKVYYKIINKK